MKNCILLDVQEYLENAYPNLTDSEIDLIAGDVSRRWDYGLLIDSVDHKVRECAGYANIPLRSPFNTETVADSLITIFVPYEANVPILPNGITLAVDSAEPFTEQFLFCDQLGCTSHLLFMLYFDVHIVCWLDNCFFPRFSSVGTK